MTAIYMHKHHNVLYANHMLNINDVEMEEFMIKSHSILDKVLKVRRRYKA